MSTAFNEDNYLKKLENVQPTQDNIQALSLWIIHHKNNHETITKLWLRKLKETTSPKAALTLFYLANDVIQNCKRKNAKIFQDSFKYCILNGIALMRHETIRKNVERTFNVWKERNVYDNEFVEKLIELLNTSNSGHMTNMSPDMSHVKQQDVDAKSSTKSPINDIEIQQLISEFQPKKLCESINAFQSIEKDTLLKRNGVDATRILEITFEHIKQYRDKSQCTQFKQEFQNSCSKVDDYIKQISMQINEREQLIKLLEQSEIFYDAQYKDAKLVVNAYRNYGLKVNALQKKLEELIEKMPVANDTKLDNLDMEMSDDEHETGSLNHTHKRNRSHSHDRNESRSPNRKSHGDTKTQSQSYSKKSLSPSIRTHLDPRQNRHGHSSSTDSGKRNGNDLSSKNEIENNSKNPLDFLTKIISKSSVNANNGTNSNLISSLQKIMANTTSDSTFTTYTSNNTDHSIYDPREYSYNGYYDDMYNDDTNVYNKKVRTTSMQQEPNQMAMYSNLMLPPAFNRAATPTKDELYPNTATNLVQQQQPHQSMGMDMISPQHAMYQPYAPHYGLVPPQQATNTVPPPPPGPPPPPPPPPQPPHGLTSDPAMYGYMQGSFGSPSVPIRPAYEYHHKPGQLNQLMSGLYPQAPPPPHFMQPPPGQRLRPPFMQSPQPNTPNKNWNFNNDQHHSNNIDLSMNEDPSAKNESANNRRKSLNNSQNSNSNAQFRFNKGNTNNSGYNKNNNVERYARPNYHPHHQQQQRHQQPYHHHQQQSNFNQKSYQIQTINSKRDQKSPYNPSNQY